MSPGRVLGVFLGVAVWAVGLWLFITSSYVGGGLLVLAGGLCLVMAVGGGWSDFFEGLANWLFFWR